MTGVYTDFVIHHHQCKHIYIDSCKKNIETSVFGINYRVFVDDEWIPIVRYDNHLHKNKSGKHLHRIDRDWEYPDTINMTLTEARKYVEELGRELRVMVVKSYENKNNL
jgi:hypothetical protein